MKNLAVLQTHFLIRKKERKHNLRFYYLSMINLTIEEIEIIKLSILAIIYCKMFFLKMTVIHKKTKKVRDYS